MHGGGGGGSETLSKLAQTITKLERSLLFYYLEDDVGIFSWKPGKPYNWSAPGAFTRLARLGAGPTKV
jgi:hypothetical protein